MRQSGHTFILFLYQIVFEFVIKLMFVGGLSFITLQAMNVLYIFITKEIHMFNINKRRQNSFSWNTVNSWRQ